MLGLRVEQHLSIIKHKIPIIDGDKQLEFLLLKKSNLSFVVITAAVLALSGCVAGNKIGQYGQDAQTTLGNISVRANQNAGTLQTTNGNISIGHHAQVKSVNVLNGNISIKEFSQATSLKTTNGNIKISDNVLIKGNVKTMNGNIRIGQHVEIRANVLTATGDISIEQGTTIRGDIIFEKPGFWSSKLEQEIPRLKISKEVSLNGDIHLYRPIELLLDQSVNPNKVIRHYEKNNN